MNRWGNEKGFTLAELLVAVAVLGLVLEAVVVVQQNGVQAYIAGSTRVEAQQNARIALDEMAREIRQASAITTANASSITFTAQGGVTSVTYALNANTITLQRNGADVVGGVQALTFVYRDRTDATGATAANTRRIDITIRTQSEDPVTAASPWNAKAQIVTSVRLRNLP